MPKYVQRPMQNNSRQYCQKSFMSHTEFSFNKETKTREGTAGDDMFSPMYTSQTLQKENKNDYIDG